jgi:hypothetical protein
MGIDVPLSITGLGALSALGSDVASHHRAVMEKRRVFRPLAGLFGNDSPHASRPGAWIDDRLLLTHRKWSPVTMAALHAARQRCVITAPQLAAELDALRKIPDQLRQVLALEPEIATIATRVMPSSLDATAKK